MTEVSTETASQTTAPAANVENQQTETVLVKNPEAVLAKNAQLLAEKKKVETQLHEALEWRKQQEQAEQEKKGDFQGVISSLREELQMVKSEKADMHKNIAYKTFEDQIKSAAVSRNCANPDKLMRLMTKEQMASVEVDGESYKVNSDDLTRLMDTLEDEHKDIGLFGKKNINLTNVTGNFNKSVDSGVSKMNADQYMEHIKTLNL